jgi:hypothetical protein
MEGEQTKNIYVISLKHKCSDPTKYIDDYQVFCNYRNRAEKARSMLIHLISLFNGGKGIYILLFTRLGKIKYGNSVKKVIFSLPGIKIKLLLRPHDFT